MHSKQSEKLTFFYLNLLTEGKKLYFTGKFSVRTDNL